MQLKGFREVVFRDQGCKRLGFAGLWVWASPHLAALTSAQMAVHTVSSLRRASFKVNF